MSLRPSLAFLAVFISSAAVRADAFPVPLTANAPDGSLIYSGSTSGTISIGETTDSFTLSLDAGQTITVDVVPSPSLEPRVELRDPSNTVIATATAAAVGQEVVLQTVPVATAGTYTISVAGGGASASTGAYTLNVILNAGLENESHGGPSDDTLATAQSLDGASINLLGTAADRMAILGNLGVGTDVYAFTLASGHSTTIALLRPLSAAVTLDLRDGSDNVLATGVAGPSNVTLAIRNFVAPVTSTYFVRVAALGGGGAGKVDDYSLIVLRDADFDIEGNDTFAGAQDLRPHVVLGAIGNGGCPDSDFYAFGVNSGDTIQIRTATPADGPGQFVNTLNPQIDLYDPSGNLLVFSVPLPDARNEEINYNATASGVYRVKVVGEGGTTGEYVLTVTGNTGTPPSAFTPSGPTPPCTALSAASPAHVWIGLKNSDNQGTNFDLKVELLKNGNVVASGLQRCITGVTRNPSLAKEAIIAFDPFSAVDVDSGDVLALSVSTRIGTNPDDTKCAGHNSAAGLRLYYDSTGRPSRFDATITPDPSQDYYLHSDGTVCGSAQSSGVTTRFLDTTAPTAANPRCKDSGSVSFSGGNPFSLIGTWSRTLP